MLFGNLVGNGILGFNPPLYEWTLCLYGYVELLKLACKARGNTDVNWLRILHCIHMQYEIA
jgi:hypothetical protein